MGQIEKIVFFKGAVETLGYFSEQIAMEMEQKGFDTFFMDLKHRPESLKAFEKFASKNHTAMITFNFIGLSGELEFEDEGYGTIWEKYQVQFFNILVDHPLYYHKNLTEPPERMELFTVDRDHVTYVKRYYKGIPVHFLPLAGNLDTEKYLALFSDSGNGRHGIKDRDYGRILNYEKDLMPYEKREDAVAFIANYVPLPNLYRHFNRLSKEYIDFYYEIIDDMKADTARPLEQVMEQHLKKEIPDVSEPDLALGMSAMIFLDLYIRSFFRGETVLALVEKGIPVHVYGKDWDKLKCVHKKNLIISPGMKTSAECVRAVGRAKISLNTMPWFKDGAHDRIFTSMLQKSVALTDGSRYLREILEDGKNVRFYDLDHLEELPDIVREIMGDQGKAETLAESGCRDALKCHTWRERAQELERYIRKTNKNE